MGGVGAVSEVLVVIQGCDDVTRVKMDVDERGMAVLLLLAALSRQESEYDCQPVVVVQEEAGDG